MTSLQEQHVINAIDTALGRIPFEKSTQYGQVTITVSADRIVDVMQRLRHSEASQFHQLMDVCGVDYPERDLRFDVVYQLLSLSHNWRVTVIAQIGEGKEIPSVTSIYLSAGWYEREAFDMFGIPFSGHSDLRRLLTDYDSKGILCVVIFHSVDMCKFAMMI